MVAKHFLHHTNRDKIDNMEQAAKLLIKLTRTKESLMNNFFTIQDSKAIKTQDNQATSSQFHKTEENNSHNLGSIDISRTSLRPPKPLPQKHSISSKESLHITNSSQTPFQQNTMTEETTSMSMTRSVM
jgi:hypothetical protein